MQMTDPVGMINRNPLNVKVENPRDPWHDARGSCLTDSQGHAVFTDVRWGIRAAARTLCRKYLNKEDEKYSVRRIVGEWTDVEKDKIPYIAYVAKQMSVTVNQDLYLCCPDGSMIPTQIGQIIRMMQAMTRWECGHQYNVPDSQWLEGLAMYLRDFVEK
jgi:hypothetical protein